MKQPTLDRIVATAVVFGLTPESAMMKSVSPLPHFAPDVERKFQSRYYARVRPTLCVVPGLLVLAILLYPLLGLTDTNAFVGASALPQMLWCLLVAARHGAHGLARSRADVWLAGLGDGVAPAIADEVAARTIAQLSFTLQVCVFMITLAAFRLRFVPTLALQIGVVAAGAGAFQSQLRGGIPSFTALQFSAASCTTSATL